jgi:hypothetical protein
VAQVLRERHIRVVGFVVAELLHPFEVFQLPSRDLALLVDGISRVLEQFESAGP